MNKFTLLPAAVLTVVLCSVVQVADATCNGPSVTLDPLNIAIPAEQIGGGSQSHVENRINQLIRDHLQNSVYAEIYHDYNVTAVGALGVTVQGHGAMVFEQGYVLTKPACERFDDPQQTAVWAPTSNEERAELWHWASTGLIPQFFETGTPDEHSISTYWWTLGMSPRYDVGYEVKCEIVDGKMVCTARVVWILIL